MAAPPVNGTRRPSASGPVSRQRGRSWNSSRCGRGASIVGHGEAGGGTATRQVLASGDSKGRAASASLREHLGQLPPSMLASDFRVNGKVMEFGLRLGTAAPADRLQVDGRCRARGDGGGGGPDPTRRLRTEGGEGGGLAGEGGRAVLDTSVTAPVAVAAVPDAAYQVLSRATPRRSCAAS